MNEQIKAVKKKIMNGNTPIVIKVIFWIVGIAFAAATSWAVVKKEVIDNSIEISRLHNDNKVICARVQECETFCAEQRIQNSWQKETLVRIESKLDKLD